MVATWLSILRRLERGDEELSPLERHLLNQGMSALAGDIDALFLEEVALQTPQS
jgi:hypothetical protein